MASRRSTQLLVLGLAAFVLGTGLVFLTLTSAKGGPPAGATTAPQQSRPRTAAETAAQLARDALANKASPAIPVIRGAEGELKLPPGKQAVAVSLPFVAGLAGHAKPGDLVNVYATVEKVAEGGTPGQVPYSRLVLQSVPVLDVEATGANGTGTATVLLALDAASAEQVIFLARFETAWLTLVPPAQPPAQTAGRNHQNLVP
ncbi:MAG: RcpC/CpaB family pilus assembly protein [Acidimicrobiia bacterium]